MTKEEILDYVMSTPENTNRMVLNDMLDEFHGYDTAALVQFRRSIQMTCSAETDATNGIYKVRTIMSPQSYRNIDGKDISDMVLCAAIGGGFNSTTSKMVISIYFYAPHITSTGEKVTSISHNKYWARSWADTYDPDVDGILNENNAPNTQFGNTYPPGSLAFYVNSYSNSDVEGYIIWYRGKLTITYDNGTTRDIWSSQMRIERTSTGVKTSFMHDPNPTGKPTDVVCMGWDVVNTKYIDGEQKGFYNGLFSTVQAAATDVDEWLEVTPEDFIYDGKPCALRQFLVFGDGSKQNYGVLHNPGILEALSSGT